jgi:hypothetical protein
MLLINFSIAYKKKVFVPNFSSSNLVDLVNLLDFRHL